MRCTFAAKTGKRIMNKVVKYTSNFNVFKVLVTF